MLLFKSSMRRRLKKHSPANKTTSTSAAGATHKRIALIFKGNITFSCFYPNKSLKSHFYTGRFLAFLYRLGFRSAGGITLAGGRAAGSNTPVGAIYTGCSRCKFTYGRRRPFLLASLFCWPYRRHFAVLQFVQKLGASSIGNDHSTTDPSDEPMIRPWMDNTRTHAA